MNEGIVWAGDARETMRREYVFSPKSQTRNYLFFQRFLAPQKLCERLATGSEDRPAHWSSCSINRSRPDAKRAASPVLIAVIIVASLIEYFPVKQKAFIICALW